MSHNTKFKRELLTFYLDKYLQKKNLKMKDFMQNIRFKLLQRNKISLKQFESIQEFLKREDAFKAASDQRIFNYFRPLITGITKVMDLIKVVFNQTPKNQISFQRSPKLLRKLQN